MSKLACSFLAVYLAAFAAAEVEPKSPDPKTVLATVGGEPITEADFQLLCAMRNIPADKQPQIRTRLLNQMIDRQLVRRFLARQKVAPDPQLLAGELAQLETLMRARQQDPDEILKGLGLTRKSLENEVGLSPAWEVYLRQVITDKTIEEHFEQHRAALDGTKLRASQIILKSGKQDKKEQIEERKAKLAAIRRDILAKKLTFADAAQQFSEARASKVKGGDVGWFPFRGLMTAEFCDAAFALKPGEISEPVVASYGVFLVQVTDVRPGEFTLEDVRAEVVGRISQELMAKTIAAEREKSPVEVAKRTK
jgi:peptidyl-prolyl cis-trans isomerase C